MLEFNLNDFPCISQQAIEMGQSLIQFYKLHDQPEESVNIGSLLAGFDLRFLDLPTTTWGFTLDIDHRIMIALNNNLTTAQTRYVAMHELGHIACWHPDQFHNCLQDHWLYDRTETEATTVAAYILIPRAALLTSLLPEEIAANYLVPVELAAIRQMLYQSTGL